MSTKHSVNEIIMEKLSEKGNRRNKGIDDAGVHKRPQMMQIAVYLENGQERVSFPDREAKCIRNPSFMTQLDFSICKKIRKENGKSKTGNKKHHD